MNSQTQPAFRDKWIRVEFSGRFPESAGCTKIWESTIRKIRKQRGISGWLTNIAGCARSSQNEYESPARTNRARTATVITAYPGKSVGSALFGAAKENTPDTTKGPRKAA